MNQPQKLNGSSVRLATFIVASIAALGYIGTRSRLSHSGQQVVPISVRDGTQVQEAASLNGALNSSPNPADQAITSTYRAWLGRVKRNGGLNSGYGNLYDAGNRDRQQHLVIDTVAVSGDCVNRINQPRPSASASGQEFADRVINQIREWCDLNMYPGALDNSPLPPAPTGPSNRNDYLPSGKTTDYGDLLK